MTNKSPKVSVIMPNYNCEKYLDESIQSILDQTFTDFEFIIVDDGSSDRSWDIIQKYAEQDERIVPIRNEHNIGVSKIRNKGLEIAQGVYIATMDSDDVSLLDRLERQVAFLEEHKEIGIVGGIMEIMNTQGHVYSRRCYNLTDKEIRKKIFRYSPFCHATTMFRKEIIAVVGGYNTFLKDAEDYELFFRIGMVSKFANLDVPTYKMRVNEQGLTLSDTKGMEERTLYIRRKAVVEYGYTMTLGDKIYRLLQCVSIYLIPSGCKVWLFNMLRNN